MLKFVLAGVLTVGMVAPVMAQTMFYVVREAGKDCKVVEEAPSEWQNTMTVVGEYESKAEAQKNMKTICAKEPPKKAE